MGFTYLAYYAQTFSLQEFLWVVDDPMDYALKFGGGIYAILPMPEMREVISTCWPMPPCDWHIMHPLGSLATFLLRF